jgi:hypothetical protein
MGVFGEGNEEWTHGRVVSANGDASASNRVWTAERIESEQAEPSTMQEIVERIKPALAGIGPKKQGFILADLVAIWMTGFHPEPVRHEMKTMFLTTLSELVEHYEAGGPRPT